MTETIKYEIKCTGNIPILPYEVRRNGDVIHHASTRQEAIKHVENLAREEREQKRIII